MAIGTIGSCQRARKSSHVILIGRLSENKVIPDDFALTLRRMAGLRNRLVHLYWEVDDKQIYDDLQNHLGDFDTYVQHILAFVQRQTPSPSAE